MPNGPSSFSVMAWIICFHADGGWGFAHTEWVIEIGASVSSSHERSCEPQSGLRAAVEAKS